MIIVFHLTARNKFRYDLERNIMEKSYIQCLSPLLISTSAAFPQKIWLRFNLIRNSNVLVLESGSDIVIDVKRDYPKQIFGVGLMLLGIITYVQFDHVYGFLVLITFWALVQFLQVGNG